MAELRVKGTGTIKLFENDNTSSVTIASPASLSANKTITLPDADVTLASGTMLATDGSGASLTALNASELGSGTVPTARLGSGTASSSTVLYGDQTYKAEPGGGKILQVVNRQTASALTITSTTPQATDLYAAITPSATTSDLYCTMSFRCQEYTVAGVGAGAVSTLQIFRDIGGGGYSSLYPSTQYANEGFSTNMSNFEMSNYFQPTFSFWDDPATTSEVTYKLYIGISLAGTNTYFVSPSPGGDQATIFEIDGS